MKEFEKMSNHLFNMMMPIKEFQVLKKQAKSEGRSMAGQIRWLIERRQKELDKEGNEK